MFRRNRKTKKQAQPVSELDRLRQKRQDTEVVSLALRKALSKFSGGVYDDTLCRVISHDTEQMLDVLDGQIAAQEGGNGCIES